MENATVKLWLHKRQNKMYVGCMWVAKFMLASKHSQLFVMVVQVPHPAEQCTANDV